MSLTQTWQWIALAGLGAFHGINPAMGWLFAVALGLQERSRATLLRALGPIALGHAASIGAVLAALRLARAVVEPDLVRLASAAILIGFGAYRLVRRHRHKPGFGMRVGFADLAVWSFIAATGHGAGLMILPVLLDGSSEMPPMHDMAAHHHAITEILPADSIVAAAVAILVHTAAMLLVAGAIAVIVFDWLGLAILRRGWINFDMLWAVALIGAGVAVLVL